MLLTATGFPEMLKKISCVQRVKRNIPKMFTIAPRTKFHLR